LNVFRSSVPFLHTAISLFAPHVCPSVGVVASEGCHGHHPVGAHFDRRPVHKAEDVLGDRSLFHRRPITALVAHPAVRGVLCVPLLGALGHLLSDFGAAVKTQGCGRESCPCTRSSPPGSIHATGQRGRVMVAITSTPSRQKCATWPMHKVTTGLIISQRVDKRHLLSGH
jgi:hypothetical protein